MKADWPALRLEFVNGSMSLADLAAKHGLKDFTVRKRAEREGWQQQRLEVSRSVTSKAQAALVERRTEELATFNENGLKLSRGLMQMVAKKINDARTQAQDLRPGELRLLASTASEAYRMGRLALGVSTDNHGHGGQDGVGPIKVDTLTPEQRAAALAQVLEDF